MTTDLPPPTLVQDARGLTRLLAELERADEIAVDTEADSFFSYHEKVCLVQITAGDEDWLIDPLAGFDMTPLGAVLADPARLKVFHDGEYDILILKRIYGFTFRNLFDTRVAAATLGSQAPGLASVLKDRFGIELDKSMQRSDWSQRPLSEKQIRYARLDTRFLLPLMREQRADLVRTQRDVIVTGECLRLEAIEPPDNSFDADEFVRLKGARALAPIERQTLRELYTLREKYASESNVPPFRVANNETLIELSRVRPRSMHDLTQVPGFTHKMARKMGDDVLAAIARAAELGPMRRFPELPSKDGTGDLTDDEIELHERLKNWRKDAAQRVGIDSAYLLNRHVLLRLVRERPLDRAALARVEGVQKWQVERHGDEIIAVIARFRDELARGALPDAARRRRWAR